VGTFEARGDHRRTSRPLPCAVGPHDRHRWKPPPRRGDRRD